MNIRRIYERAGVKPDGNIVGSQQAMIFANALRAELKASGATRDMLQRALVGVIHTLEQDPDLSSEQLTKAIVAVAAGFGFDAAYDEHSGELRLTPLTVN